jgi:hypothetical protein
MARTHIDKRSRLVSAAVGLAYQNGFGATSLTDIAREDGLENAPEAFTVCCPAGTLVKRSFAFRDACAGFRRRRFRREGRVTSWR